MSAKCERAYNYTICHVGSQRPELVPPGVKGHSAHTHQSEGCPQQRSAEPLECGGETNIVGECGGGD